MKKIVLNEFRCRFPALSENESFARLLAAGFVAQASPTVSQLADIKCAVSEAVTNCIVHAYRDAEDPLNCLIEMRMKLLSDSVVLLTIRDFGCGIPDVEKAREPLFTTDLSGERSGMGFAIMENLMDSVTVRSAVGRGTSVTLRLHLDRSVSFRKAVEEKCANIAAPERCLPCLK